MNRKIFITGDMSEPKSVKAIERFEDAEKAEYLVTGELSESALKHIIFHECSGQCEWHIRRSFDPLIDNIDTGYCQNYIFDSISDYIQHLIVSDTNCLSSEHYAGIVIDVINSLTDRICSTGGTLILISDDAGVIDTDIRRKRLIRSAIFDVNRYISHYADEVIMVEHGTARRIK